jgi:hypothetical protein
LIRKLAFLQQGGLQRLDLVDEGDCLELDFLLALTADHADLLIRRLLNPLDFLAESVTQGVARPWVAAVFRRLLDRHRGTKA